jgi:hypothetical protein
MGLRHLNAFFTVDGARKCVGTFSADEQGEVDARHALAIARSEAKQSGHDVSSAKSVLAFVDTEVLQDDGKTVQEFGSLGELEAAAPHTKKSKKGA